MAINTLLRLMLMLTLMVACGVVVTFAAQHTGQERIVGLPCEGCEAVFVNMPARIDSHSRIAPVSERGEPMKLRGRVLDARGAAVAGVVVYAYQTDSSGIYPADVALHGSAAARHGKLRGWARSNEKGEYEFDTIRPGPYPGRSEPQHIHLHVIELGRCTYYIDDVQFTDDPRLTAQRRASPTLRGGPGISTPARDDRGVWQVTRDIHLGKNIPGYTSCESQRSQEP